MALIFDESDQADINKAIAAGGQIWYNPCLDRLKRKIKDYFTNDHTCQCCYCARLFTGEFNMVIDIEHILPQDVFPTERFIVSNLNIACKRCNMEIKKADISFITNIPEMGVNYYQSQHYQIVHPNIDTYTTHIVLKQIRRGDFIYIKYVLRDQNKAKFTYNYFKLKDLEVDTINKAQGAKNIKSLNAKISDGIRRTLLSLLTRI